MNKFSIWRLLGQIISYGIFLLGLFVIITALRAHFESCGSYTVNSKTLNLHIEKEAEPHCKKE